MHASCPLLSSPPRLPGPLIPQGMFHFEFFHQAATDAGLTSPESPRVVCKPSAAAYNLVFKRLGVRPEEALFFDDSVRNIRGAHELGIMTVLVSAMSHQGFAWAPLR